MCDWDSFMRFLRNASRFAESTPPLYEKAIRKSASAAFLEALKACEKAENLHSRLHIHKNWP